jgi:hypothetical protein
MILCSFRIGISIEKISAALQKAQLGKRLFREVYDHSKTTFPQHAHGKLS